MCVGICIYIYLCDIVLDYLIACRQFYHVLYPFKCLQGFSYSFSFL